MNGKNILENVDYAEGESQSVTDFLEIDCNKCGNKIKFKLAIGDIADVEKYIEKQKADIETLKRDFEIVDHECNRLEQEDIRKDMIINEMTEELVKAHEWFYSEFDNYTKEDFIKYFENKVKESK